MSELITTLHPQDDNSVNLYPNVKLENIVDGTAEDAGKFVKVNEEGKFIVDTVNIPEPQQVNNSTVTIKQGGVDKGSFTLNQAEDATIELDAGGAGDSGSSMYATSSAISKGVPAHKEAATPIQVGDTISQLYFNTQQDINSYLETCVDWNNGNKIINAGDGTLVYPLLTGVGDENAAGFRELKNFDYIYGLKIKADYEPGDGKVDPELNAWLADILVGEDYMNLFYVQSTSSSGVGLKASKKETGSGTEYILSCTEYVGTIIYSSITGFKSGTNNWDSSKHAYKLVFGENNNEVIIKDLHETYSAGWNGIFFGAVSGLGEIILSAVRFASSSDMPSELYMLMSNALSALHSDNPFDSLYYVSAPFPGLDVSINVGWQASTDQAVALSGPKKVTSVNSAVSKIASSEANWVSVPEVFGSIYQDNILGTDEVKINDILVDTTGTLGKVKEFSEESFKNQHPANPFAVGDEIPANSYIYIDTSITPDLSKIDWSGFVSDGSSGLSPLVPLGYFQLMNFPQSMAVPAFGIKLNKPIYTLMIGEAVYTQVDPSDVDKLAGSSLIEDLGGDMNTWIFHSEQVTHEGSIFKVPLGNSEAVTLTDISDQDVWGAFISKDGRWVEDTPISRTKVSCETLRRLPTNYENLDGIPILKLDYIIGETEGYEFIPENYENKYIQDLSGIIYFCDGRDLHQLKGSKERTININARDGLKNYGTSIGPSIYSVDIGLTDTSSGTYTGDVDSTYTEVLTRHNPSSGTADSYTWRSIKAIQPEILAGNGISKSGNTVSLASDVRERLIPPTDGLDSLYRYHLVLPDSTKLSSIFWEKTKSTSIGTGLVEEPTNPSEQTLKIGLSSSDLDYTQPNTKVYAKNTNSNTFGWVSLPSQSGTSVQAGSGINVSGNTVSLTSEYANRSISSANSGMYVMARDGSTMNQIGWSSVSIPRGVKAGTGLVSDTYDSYTDTLSLSQDVQDKLARIPDLPSADGNYALTCTITGGVPTFAWTLATN